jgi:hypothetical protein
MTLETIGGGIEENWTLGRWEVDSGDADIWGRRDGEGESE